MFAAVLIIECFAQSHPPREPALVVIHVSYAVVDVSEVN